MNARTSSVRSTTNGTITFRARFFLFDNSFCRFNGRLQEFGMLCMARVLRAEAEGKFAKV